MVFQDSYASLNPRLTIERRSPSAHGARRAGAEAARRRAHDLLAQVGLEPDALRRPLSARAVGRPAPARQHRPRAGARAAAGDPRRGGVGARQVGRGAGAEPAAVDLKDEFGLTYIFISHDLNVVRFIGDRVHGDVSRQGRRDRARSSAIYAQPAHPYTRGAARRRCRRWTRRGARRRRRSRAIRPTRSTRRRAAASARAAPSPRTSARRRSPLLADGGGRAGRRLPHGACPASATAARLPMAEAAA